MKKYLVYILSGVSRTLYIGVTNDIERHVREHKRRLVPGFIARYRINRLVYVEETTDVRDAIAREKQIKSLASCEEDRAHRIREPRLEGSQRVAPEPGFLL